MICLCCLSSALSVSYALSVVDVLCLLYEMYGLYGMSVVQCMYICIARVVLNCIGMIVYHVYIACAM